MTAEEASRLRVALREQGWEWSPPPCETWVNPPSPQPACVYFMTAPDGTVTIKAVGRGATTVDATSFAEAVRAIGAVL